MSETVKHTPGPWAIDYEKGETHALINAKCHIALARVVWKMDGKEPEDNPSLQANAHLIAAAPDLLEALKRLSVLADEIWIPLSNQEGERLLEAWAFADAAIAKAEGRP